jgi:hypothetical protein
MPTTANCKKYFHVLSIAFSSYSEGGNLKN